MTSVQFFTHFYMLDHSVHVLDMVYNLPFCERPQNREKGVFYG